MDKELVQLNDFYKKAMDLAHEWGLKPFETDFHVVPSHKIYEVASYGIPNHYNHWSYGRDYFRQKTMYDHGYGKIYELVINSDPAQAFLLDTNSLLENCFVIAHVIGHSDFFANNAYFAHTNRDIETSAAATASRFREYEMEYGRYVVESFIDDVMAIQEHIDPHMRTKKITKEYDKAHPEHQFIDLFPEDAHEIRRAEESEKADKFYKFPYQPQRDILAFLAEHARLRDWQRDVIMSMRDEMIYFLPQYQTKIMNEGWASIIHHKLMHALDPECDPGGIDFADTHSGVLSGRPGRLNPYWLGFNIYKRIEKRWDNPTDYERNRMDMPGNEGWAKCLEVRSLDRDETFLRDYLDKQICEDLDLFSYAFDEEEAVWWITDKSWEKVRDNLVSSKVNWGMPYISVVDVDFMDAGGLLLKHSYDGRPLDPKYAAETLKSTQRIWSKPVWLETEDDSGIVIYQCEGEGKKVVMTDMHGAIRTF